MLTAHPDGQLPTEFFLHFNTVQVFVDLWWRWGGREHDDAKVFI